MKRILSLLFVVMLAMVMQAQEIITTQPEGTLKTYRRSGSTIKKGAVSAIESSLMNVVYADDGETVYIQDPLSGFTTGTWVKGTLSGNTITVPTGQMIYSFPFNETLIADCSVCIMNKVSDAPLDYAVDESVTSFSYTIDGDNLLLNGTSTDGSVILGLAASASGLAVWGSVGDFNVSCALFTDEAVTMPEGVPAVEYAMEADNGSPVTGTVKVARDGNDVYIQGLYPEFPTGTVKGTMSADGTVTFPKGQFMGIVYPFTIYLVGASNEQAVEDESTDLRDVVFTYDAANDRYVLQTAVMAFNDNKNKLYPFNYYTDCVLKGPQTNGIEKAEVSQGKPGTVTYYNLKGQRLSSPVKGVVIRKTVSEDGKVKVVKVQVK